jgi:hypothetical protein
VQDGQPRLRRTDSKDKLGGGDVAHACIRDDQIKVRDVLGQLTGTPTIVRGKYCVTCVDEHLDDGNQELWVIIGNDDAQGP